MKRDQHYLPDYFFTLCFLRGLKDTIQHAVKCHKPPDLHSAYWYAIHEELAYLSIHKKQTSAPTQAKQATAQNSTRAKNFKDNKVRPVADKPRERGKCWYCPEDWTHGHKCANIKSMLHAIEMQGHNDEEEEDIPAHAIPQNPNHILHLPEAPQEDIVVQAIAEQLMLLSVEALHGIPREGTLAVQISIGNKQVVALIDSDSTNTFIEKNLLPGTTCRSYKQHKRW
jgi:hypothetical protein